MEPGLLAALVALAFLAGACFGWIFAARRGRAAENEAAALRARLEERAAAGEEKLAAIREAEARLRDAFQALSAEALRSSQTSFLELARASMGEFQKVAQGNLEAKEKAIGDLVRPVADSLRQVDARLADVEKARLEAYTELKTQVRTLAESQATLQSETANLVKALRAPAVRGRWGEVQLKRVVEMAGMVEQCDFVQQESVTADDRRLRPDLVVKLPGGKQVVVDAKVPLAAYLEALEAPDEAGREAHLAHHARQVKDHMTKLGSKGYWSQFDASPEFVVMFLPGESFFSAALQRDPELLDFGVSHRVIPASPTTLIALLRAVAYGWTQERIAESAQEVAALGRELYERIRSMAGHLDKLGGSLDRAVAAFNEAVGSFEGRVLPQARRFRDLGTASGSEEIPLLEPIGSQTREIQAPDARPPS